MSNLTIAVCQMKVSLKKEDNLIRAVKMVSLASANGAKMVILPEMFNCPYSHDYFSRYAEEQEKGETFQALKKMAQKNQIYLIAGSLPEKNNNKIYNSSPIYGPNGQLLACHRKIHLFDIDLKDSLHFQESATLTAGNTITLVDTPWGKVGIVICYDIRFPELFSIMAEKGAKIVVVPAAFNLTTGPAHWELTLRMRAVDNQIYMLGASPARSKLCNYTPYGHSLIADPWGRIVAEAGTDETIIYHDIDLTKIKEIRAQLPLLQHKRQDIYHTLYHPIDDYS